MKSSTLVWVIPLSIVLGIGVLWASLSAVSWLATRDDNENAEFQEAEDEDSDRPEVVTSGPLPQVVVEEDKFEFGVMEVGQEQIHTFTIRNAGKGKLVLKKGKTSCKCTISKLTKGEVAPGASVDIELSWRPEETSERFRQVAKIFTNDPKKPEFELSITGTVTDRIEIETDSWRISAITSDEPISVETRVFSKILDDFNVLGVTCDHDSITGAATPLTAQQLSELKAKSGYLIKVRVDPKELDIQFREKVVVRTDVADKATFTLFVEGIRQGPLRIIASGARYRAETRMINIDKFPAGEGKKIVLSMFVERFNEEGFQISDLSYDAKVIKVDIAEDTKLRSKRRQRFELTIEVPAGRPPTTRIGANRMEIVLKTNHPKLSELRLRLEFRSF